jgi:hypothetical protein
MGASNPVYVGGSLLAVTILMGGPAPATEAGQAPAATPSSSSSPSAWALPSYFDGARLPDLREAWRPRDSVPASAAPAADSTSAATPPNDDAALAGAKAAMVRAEQAGREATAVRQKAEELSRRFGNDSGPAAAAETAPAPAAATAADTATGSIEPRAPLPPASALGARPPGDPAAETAATSPETTGADKAAADPKPDDPVTPAAATQKPPVGMRGTVTEDGRPTPDRSKSASTTAPPRSKTATTETAPATTPVSKTTPGPSGKADTMPASIGAFGWDSQPQ